MNKTSICLVAISIVSATTAIADSGQVRFVGRVLDEACTVTNNVTNPLTVVLGDVFKGAFTGKGSTAAPTKFTLSLTECPVSVTSAKVKFDGLSDNNDNTVLALTAEDGVATNVGIQLADVNNNVIPLYSESESHPINEGDNNLDFVARYIQTSATAVTPGPANAVSNFSIIYN
jgi:major type 1 subunit fimbrin (pilin)